MTTSMPARPRLKPHVSVVPVGPENVLVRGPGLFVRFSGPAVAALLDIMRHLDGTRDLAAIAAASGLSEEDVRDILEALVEDKVVEDAAEDDAAPLAPKACAALAPQLGLFSHLTGRPHAAQARITTARVLVLGDGGVARAVVEALAAAGVGAVGSNLDAPKDIKAERVALPSADLTRVFANDFAPLVKGWDHVVLATDAPLPETFLHLNDAALQEKVTWTGVFLDGLEASVGPTVIPWQTACWRCYDLRAKGAHPNLDRLLAYEANTSTRAQPFGFAAFATVAGAWAAQAVLLTLSKTALPPLAGELTRLRMLDFKAERHRVLRIPRCPSCTRTNIPDVDRYALETVRLS